MNRKYLLLALCLFALPLPVRAQRAESVPVALESLDSGAVLRIRTGRQTLRGDYLGMSNQGLALGLENGDQRAILFNDVNDIWRQGNYWKRGAIIGGVTGATALSAFGLFLINALCESDESCKNDRPKVVLYSVVVGGGVGGFVGGGLGYLAKRWIRIY